MEENNKSFYERAKELADACTVIKENGVYETLAKEYGIGLRTAGDRFKSLFGKCVRDYISEKNTPTRGQMIDAIIKCESSDEVKQYLGLSSYWMVGIYDKYFGVSTFAKSKVKLLAEKEVVPYNPTIEDNLSILLSQKLGDGSFETYDGRSSIKIEHSEKQYDYLKMKVNILCKAFPNIPTGIGNIRKRVQSNGYVSYVWRSNNFHCKAMDKAIEMPLADAVHSLTPFGWCLWYLDDGNLSLTYGIHHLSIAIHDEDVRNAAVEELKTYGFNFSAQKECIIISDYIAIAKFINCFVKPFMHLIPESMHYKCFIKR